MTKTKNHELAKVQLSKDDVKVQFILDCLLQFMPRAQIKTLYTEKFQKKDLCHFYKKAHDEWKTILFLNREELRAKSMKNLEHLYYVAFQKGKLQICLSLLQEMNKLNNLYTHTEQENNQVINIQFNTLPQNEQVLDIQSQEESNGN